MLAAAWDNGPAGPVMWVIGVVVALLTAFYMTRLVIMTFFGPKENWRDKAAYEEVPDLHHRHLDPEHIPREPTWTMTVPLVVLAVFATAGRPVQYPLR